MLTKRVKAYKYAYFLLQEYSNWTPSFYNNCPGTKNKQKNSL